MRDFIAGAVKARIASAGARTADVEKASLPAEEGAALRAALGRYFESLSLPL
jgi:hypothetical protein